MLQCNVLHEVAQAKPTAQVQAIQREVNQGAEEPLPELTQEGEMACLFI
jgi:hypothetical protein